MIYFQYFESLPHFIMLLKLIGFVCYILILSGGCIIIETHGLLILHKYEHAKELFMVPKRAVRNVRSGYYLYAIRKAWNNLARTILGRR